MKIVRFSNEMLELTQTFIQMDKSIGFVPTMGALHSGHLSLIDLAKQQNNICVCSIFVNPTQFNNAEDLKNYPSSIENDLEKLKKANCDVVFIPSIDEMYKESLSVDEFNFNGLDQVMEGEFRPNHFDGVATIVKKLFEHTLPNKAYFGEKDYQQLLIVKKITADFFPKTNIVACPIVREKDGLAMSSRNALLSSEERSKATLIYKTAKEAQVIFKESNAEASLNYIKKIFDQNTDFIVDYIQLTPVHDITKKILSGDTDNCRLFIAVFLGEVRLIDNFLLSK